MKRYLHTCWQDFLCYHFQDVIPWILSLPVHWQEPHIGKPGPIHCVQYRTACFTSRKSYNFFLLGEPRADIYGDNPIGGEASQGMERLPFNTINKENVGISNYGDMYKIINQINQMIAKTTETTILTEATQNYYLGEAYGMRAYLYFHLLRSWGDVVLYLDYTEGRTLI